MHRAPLASRVGTAIVIAALSVSSLASIASPALARTGEGDDPGARLDLPAALPISADLEDAGFPDFGWGYMDTEVAEDFFVDLGDDPDYTAAWQETGYVTGFTKSWQPRASIGTPPSENDSTFIIGSISQFETADGASDALALIDSDEAGDLPSDFEDYAIDLGDEASHISFSFDGSGDVMIHTITIREENLIGEISVFYGDDFSTDEDDRTDAIVDLAGMVDAGLQDVVAGETPNLGQLAPFYEDGGLLDYNDYLYRDGALTELFPGETAEMGRGREQGYADDNATAVYRVMQPIVADGDRAPHYGVSTTITAFASSRDAKAWLAGRPDDLEAAAGVIDVEPYELDADLLPEGIAAKDVSAFTYTMDFGDDEPYYKIQVNVRVGTLGFTTYLESAVATPGEEALMGVVGDVAAAIEQGSAPASLEVPTATQADADALAEQDS
ncbi:MAG: hypothetical protein ACTHQE_18060 [Thermomicrobiales bacterium]